MQHNYASCCSAVSIMSALENMKPLSQPAGFVGDELLKQSQPNQIRITLVFFTYTLKSCIISKNSRRKSCVLFKKY